MSRSRRHKAVQVPLSGICTGPDKKGRFSIPIPNSERKLHFYSGVPGEKVLVRRGKRGRRGEQGDLLEVLSPSDKRREPPCLHFGVCGGCTTQHLPESSALEMKTELQYQFLSQIFPEVELFDPVASPQQYAYRTKVELTFLRDKAGLTSLGFHRRGRFDRGVDVSRCWLTPLSAELLDKIRSWFKRHHLVGWDPRHNNGDLRYLLYRRSSYSSQDLVALVVDQAAPIDASVKEDFTKILRECGVSGGLLLRQSSVAGAVVADSVESLYGPPILQEQIGHLKFELGWNSFFQVNPRAYQLLLERMNQWRLASAGSRILDLFCGVGSIGLSLYQPSDRLLGVELVEQAVLDARENAERNRIPAKFEQRTAETWTDFETDLLILDPPRSGCHPKLLKVLAEQAPAKEIFYVSCNPHRLQEELAEISLRYELKRAQAFDFFPQTHHVELLLQFVKRA